MLSHDQKQIELDQQQKEFHIAVEGGDLEKVKQLFKDTSKSIDLNSIQEGVSPLHRATFNNHIPMVEYLLELDGIDINIINPNDGSAALHVASYFGYVDIVRSLISKKANINLLSDKYFTTPIAYASQENRLEVVKILLEAKADPNVRRGKKTPLDSALFMAAKKGDIMSLNLLIEAKADLNLGNNNNETPAYVATENNHIDILRGLIKAKADLNLSDFDGVAPIHLAAQEDDVKALNLLIEARADLNLRNHENETPAYLGAKNNHINIINALADAKADLNLADASEMTPVNIAAQEGHLNLIQKLIEVKADTNHPSKDGLTPVLTAALNGHEEVMKKLDKRNNFNKFVSANYSVPQIAAYYNVASLIRELFTYKTVNLNESKPNADGFSPLHIAIMRSNYEAIQALLDCNVSLSVRDTRGKKPLFYANDNVKSFIFLQMLRKYIAARLWINKDSPLVKAHLDRIIKSDTQKDWVNAYSEIIESSAHMKKTASIYSIDTSCSLRYLSLFKSKKYLQNELYDSQIGNVMVINFMSL